MNPEMYGGPRRKNNELISGQILKRVESPPLNHQPIVRLKDDENLKDCML